MYKHNLSAEPSLRSMEFTNTFTPKYFTNDKITHVKKNNPRKSLIYEEQDNVNNPI